MFNGTTQLPLGTYRAIYLDTCSTAGMKKAINLQIL